MASTKVETIMDVKNLDVTRSNSLVIKNASFKIDKGDYVGIVGPNGGGKTTLLLALLGILPKKAGSIKLFGNDIKSFSNWEKLAYVSQTALNFDVHFPLTVRELVGLGRVNRGIIGRKLRRSDWDAVDESLGFMGIKNIADKRIGELSGGQKQRVFVAKALVRNPELIFLDEPVTGVDAVTQEMFFKKLSDLKDKRGITILIVSHDLTAVFCRMSKVMCVNREVNVSEITEDFEPNDVLRDAYGEHFHFVFHRHTCEGVFNNG
ncbi:MAG: ABC transporter ATP-binding protein [Thermoplasmata archaeon]|nr:MAG: ABC transporter ATP-binding protein [Thermoplasmata archaeon]